MLLSDDKQIVLSHVDLRYDDHLVLSDVSIEIFRGDFALIVGPQSHRPRLPDKTHKQRCRQLR